MKIINRTPHNLLFNAFASDDRLKLAALNGSRVTLPKDGEAVVWSNSGYCDVVVTTPNQGFYHGGTQSCRNEDTVLIQQTSAGHVIINWSRLQRDYLSPLPGQSHEAERRKEANYALAGMDVLNTIFSFLPLPGSALVQTASGIISSIAPLMDAGGSGTLTEEDVRQAVREVIREELNAQYCEQAAVLMTIAQNYITRKEAEMAQGAMRGPNELQRFYAEINEFTKASGDHYRYLNYMRNNPEEARTIFPAYMMGISAFLKMKWHVFVQDHMRGDPLTPQGIEDIRQEVEQFRVSLNRILNYGGELDEILHTHWFRNGAQMEVNEFIGSFNLKKISMRDADPALAFSERMHDFSNMLYKDILTLQQGGKDLHIFKSNWGIQ